MYFSSMKIPSCQAPDTHQWQHSGNNPLRINSGNFVKQQQLFLGLEASSALLPILALEQVAELARGSLR